MAPQVVHVLDYGAGNVRSVNNAIVAAGVPRECVKLLVTPEALQKLAETSGNYLVFPGVGSFGAAMAYLEAEGYCAFESLPRFCAQRRK